jgi:RNA polymerase sigma-70 factor (ECF subfamily)
MVVKADSFQQGAAVQTGWAGVAEQDLVARFLGGDRSAFERIVELHQARVARLAWRLLGWKGEAEDVVQEVFVKALENLHKFRRQSSLGTWLAAMTINECRKQRRRRLLRLMFLRRAREPNQELAADQEPIAGERAHLVQRAVRELGTKHREVVVLRYLEGMDIDEMVRVLRLSRSAVEVRLHRARQELKQVLAGVLED